MCSKSGRTARKQQHENDRIARQKDQAQLTYTTEPLPAEPSSVNVHKTVDVYLLVELAPYQTAHTPPGRTLHFTMAASASKALPAQHEFFTH